MKTLRPLGWVALLSVVAASAAPVAVVGVVATALVSPSGTAELPEPKPPAGGGVTRLYDSHGTEIARFREFERHLKVEREDIPEHLKKAVVAMEDRTFYRHRGIELRAILRAAFADLRTQEIVQGGSTITQQYVKLAYTGRERTFGRKVREAILAGQLDSTVDKEEILFRYLSAIYLGEGAYGVGAAAETYFRKPVKNLTLSESALLAGLIPAPSRYEPRGNPSLAEQRRRLVLDRMLAEGFITGPQHADAMEQRIWLAGDGAPYGPMTVVHPPQEQLSAHPYFVDYVRRYLIARHGDDAVFRGGLEVRTTLDPSLAAAAERAVAAALDGTKPPLDMALAAVDPRSGHVVALVGGRDFTAPGGQVNLALGRCPQPSADMRSRADVSATCWEREAVVVDGGGSGRQPGSSWKPIVLAAAFDQGISDTRVYSAPSAYRIPGCTGDRGCVIENFEGSGGGRATLRRATHRSYNTVYAQVIRDVGVAKVGEMAKRLGISSAWVASPEVHGISYALGVQEVAPLDMASAFGVFAANGLRAERTPVLTVRDRSGKVLEDNRRPDLERALDEHVAFRVTDVLKGVITEGTATGADIGRPAAGKTGTAQEFRDAWFVGFVPTLSTAVWMGYRDRPAPLLDVKGVARVTGGSIPAATWKAFMTEALAGVPPTDFTEPPPPTTLPPSTIAGDSTTTSYESPAWTTTTSWEYPSTSTTTSTTTSTPRSTSTTTQSTLLPSGSTTSTSTTTTTSRSSAAAHRPPGRGD